MEVKSGRRNGEVFQWERMEIRERKEWNVSNAAQKNQKLRVTRRYCYKNHLITLLISFSISFNHNNFPIFFLNYLWIFVLELFGGRLLMLNNSLFWFLFIYSLIFWLRLPIFSHMSNNPLQIMNRRKMLIVKILKLLTISQLLPYFRSKAFSRLLTQF